MDNQGVGPGMENRHTAMVDMQKTPTATGIFANVTFEKVMAPMTIAGVRGTRVMVTDAIGAARVFRTGAAATRHSDGGVGEESRGEVGRNRSALVVHGAAGVYPQNPKT